MRILRLGQQQLDPAELLLQRGAIVQVEITVPKVYAEALKNQNQEPPTPQVVPALVDTGASISTISMSLATAAGLVSTGPIQIGTAGGTVQGSVYASSVTLPEYGINFDPLEIGGTPTGLPPEFQMLIGRDILRHLVLDYHGPKGEFLLEQAKPEEAKENGGLLGVPTPIWIGGGAALSLGLLFGLGAFD